MPEMNPPPLKKTAPLDFAPFELTPFAPVMGQSADWIAPGSHPLGLVGGDTAVTAASRTGVCTLCGCGIRRQDNEPSWFDIHDKSHFLDKHTCAAKNCHILFQTARELQQHALDQGHHAFLCTCGKGYTRSSALNRHIKEAKEPRQYECPCCETSPAFKRPGHVEQHLRAVHQVSKKATMDALLELHQVSLLKDSRRRKAAGHSSAGTPATGPYTCFSPSALSPVHGFAGVPSFPAGDSHLASTPGFFAVPAAGFAEAPTGFPAPPIGVLGCGRGCLCCGTWCRGYLDLR
ncbi:hypothetical protein VSDG_08301 [Cytospora chrysosperma]|uniref:C2H2-type domain-containing protein n=1 Tax=Cytospora chrysosperma TaxID=252740 RepID=A0A423VIF8_CYTCH|nr:hypothetical protein VSDG_08301 [Valsa sordida]